MKPTKLTIHNIGLISDTVIDINKSLLLFYGEVMAGKTTILNAVRWVMGGGFPDDIVNHGEQESFIQFEGVDGEKAWVIRREFYVAKDQTVKARAILFTRGGIPVKQPTAEIQKFLNPFLLDQSHLVDMNERERAKYLVELFGVDTTAEDKAIADAAKEASELRVKVKLYGQIDVTPVETVDAVELSAKRSAIFAVASKQANDIDAQNEKIKAHNSLVDARQSEFDQSGRDYQTISDEIEKLQKRMDGLIAKGDELAGWLKINAKQDLIAHQAFPDTSALDAAISDAKANNVRAEQYASNVKRQAEKTADEKKILELEATQRTLKEAKVAKLADIGSSAKVPGLVFSENGSFSYEGTDAGMLSDSQLMRLSQGLSALYPQGFGISLIDRGESLGKSVMALVEQARKNESTILCTVVGEKPAKVPEDVGAFVVEKGKVTK